jgi:hypothetical protein
MTLTPALFTSARADGTDTTKLRPSNWNRVVAILNSILDGADATGSILLRDAADATDGATWLPAVAAGSVLVSSGVGVAPAWSASPSLTKVLTGDGTSAAPPWAFTSESGLGLYRSSAGQLTVANANVSGGIPFNLGTSGFQLGSAMQLSWSNTTSALSAGGDIALVREAAGVLGQRVGATAQAQRIYNTFTDASNYERLRLQWSSNLLELGTEAAGTGVQRDLRFDGAQLLFRSAGVTRWVISGSGFLTAFADNTYDIGGSGSGRPRNLNIGGTLAAAGGATLGYAATVATTSAGPRLSGIWLPRIADISGSVLLDYQDEYAFLDGRGVTVSVTPASSSGATSDLFHDDSQSLVWATGLTGGQVQITIDHSTGAGVVPNRNNGSYQVGLTFRSDFVGPGHIKIEAWTSASGGSFSTVYDADVTIFGGAFGAWVSPTFVSPDASFNMLKTRLTLSGLPDPTTGNFRVQRVALYHSTAPWDLFHLGVGGGTLYGALSFAGTAGGDTTITRTAAGKLSLTGTTPMLQLGGTTSSFPALKRNSAVLEARLADDSAYASLAAAGLQLNAGTGTTGTAGVQIFSSFAAAGNVNTGETDLISFLMPANTLAVDGQKVRITVGGSLAANANAKTIKLYFGSTVLVTDNGTVNSGGFRLSAEVVRTGAATQVSNATSMMLRALLNGFTATAETLANAITIKVTGQSGTASNDVIAKYMLVEWLPQ